jgi:polar amino acid transport system substrate-binding protein
MQFKSISLLFIAILLIAACNETTPSKSEPTNPPQAQATVSTPCKLTVGWDPWEPYMYLTPGNKVSGLDIEIIEALAAEAECELSFEQDDWMTLLSKIEQGTVDLVAGASVTEKRKEYALFTKPYRAESFVLYVRAGEANQFGGSLKQILDSGKKIGVTTDYIYGDEVSDLQDSPQYAKQFINSPVGEANYYNLLQHTVDVIIEDPFVGAYNLKRKGISDQIEQLPITIHSGDVHLMFSIKSVDHSIVERFNQAIDTIKNNGIYQKILKRYTL